MAIKNNYFEHYSELNNISLSSEESIRSWLNKSAEIYKNEIGNYIPDILDRNVLELGCGIGGFLYYLKQIDHNNYCGVDSDSGQIKICREYASDNCYLMDVFKFLEKNIEKYDIIVMYDFIEHFNESELERLFSEIKNHLSTDGIIVVRTPNMSAFMAIKMRYMDITHQIGFTEWSLYQFLRRLDFTDINIRNQQLGRRRLWLIRFIHKIFCRIHYSTIPKIVTPNLLAFIKK